MNLNHNKLIFPTKQEINIYVAKRNLGKDRIKPMLVEGFVLWG